MRTKGYKCFNVKCGGCVGHSLCGESADTALGCASRMVNMVTNADRIRAMSDEELAEFLQEARFYCNRNCEKCLRGTACIPMLQWLKQPWNKKL